MRELTFQDLTLQNFRCHEELEFSFTPNRFVSITGGNGKGKTTIFSALAWAIYDKTMDGQSGDDIVRRRSGKNAVVSVTWSDGENNYKVVAHRKHHKFKNRRFLYKNEIDISCNTEAETLKLIENLVMPKDVFMNCLLFSQYVQNHFMDLTHSGQKEIIDAVLSLSEYDKYAESIINASKLVDSSISILANKCNVIDSVVSEKRSQITYVEEQKCKAQQRYDDTVMSLQERLESLQAKLNKLKSIDNKDAVTTDKQLRELLNEKAGLEAKIEAQRETYRNQISDLDGVMILERTAKGREVENKYQEILLNLQKSLHEAQSKKLEAEKRKAEVLGELERQASIAVEKKTEESAAALQPVKEQIDQVSSRLRVLNERLKTALREEDTATKESVKYNKALEKENPECAACGQELKDEKALLKIQKLSIHCQDTVNKLQKELVTIEKEREECSEQYKELTHEFLELEEKFNTEKTALQQKIDKKRKDTANQFVESLNAARTEEGEARQKIETAEKERSKEHAAIEEEIQSEKAIRVQKIKEDNQSIAMTWIVRLKEVVPEIQSNEEKLERFNNCVEQMSQTDREIASVEATLSEVDSRYKIEIKELYQREKDIQRECKEQQEQLQQLQEEMARQNRKNVILKFWKKGFSDVGIKAILLDESVPILNERARDLCQLVPNLKVRFSSQKQLKSGESRNKFSIDVLQTQNLSELKDLSAGERRMTDIIVLLCLRHLLETIQDCKMNVLLLDEILDSLDPENTAAAIDMVKRLSDTHCVVLISHTLREFLEADESLCM
jgi:exonuclease SbcC